MDQSQYLDVDRPIVAAARNVAGDAGGYEVFQCVASAAGFWNDVFEGRAEAGAAEFHPAAAIAAAPILRLGQPREGLRCEDFETTLMERPCGLDFGRAIVAGGIVDLVYSLLHWGDVMIAVDPTR